jgi:dihydroflavonol-4-reductase
MTTVLVTGASGFIAKHIIRELLENDYTVKASVRSQKGREQLEALFPDAQIGFVTLDLLKDDGWAEAFDGVDVLMHTASPFPQAAPKNPEDLIRPAVDGTLRAMRAAYDGGVRRVVLTSSCAAIYKDKTKTKMAISTRENWTDPSAPDTAAYEASKTLAERAAWDFVAVNPEMNLTTINPGGVFGTPMDEHFGTSLYYVEEFLSGRLPAVPHMNAPGVDVRDVARMHVRAISNEATFGLRFPAVAGVHYLVDITRALKVAYPDRRIPTREMPSWLLRFMSQFVPVLRAAINDLGRNMAVVGTDAPEVMGFTYIPFHDSVRASAQFLVERGK